ncbi:hypothetical protein MBH78_09355 [Oceanimonas sp. NS1]|nr:hypothetical protein [Oceanimonas sp. NS1]
MPALVFRCDDCRWRELALGKAGFQLSPLHAENGVQLDDLWLDGPLLQGRAQGRWLQHDSGDLTRLQWRGGRNPCRRSGRLWMNPRHSVTPRRCWKAS